MILAARAYELEYRKARVRYREALQQRNHVITVALQEFPPDSEEVNTVIKDAAGESAVSGW
jgi:hypothetical protein